MSIFGKKKKREQSIVGGMTGPHVGRGISREVREPFEPNQFEERLITLLGQDAFKSLFPFIPLVYSYESTAIFQEEYFGDTFWDSEKRELVLPVDFNVVKKSLLQQSTFEAYAQRSFNTAKYNLENTVNFCQLLKALMPVWEQ